VDGRVFLRQGDEWNCHFAVYTHSTLRIGWPERESTTIAREHPEIIPGLPDVDRELVAKYCWETNTNFDAVKLMLDLGFPVAHPERSHGYTPLHNAAWAGSGDLVELLITRGHPVDIRDPGHDATPLAWALYDCLVEKRHPEGEFARVVKALLEAGSPLEGVEYPTGDEAVDRYCTRISKLSPANSTAPSGSSPTFISENVARIAVGWRGPNLVGVNTSYRQRPSGSSTARFWPCHQAVTRSGSSTSSAGAPRFSSCTTLPRVVRTSSRLVRTPQAFWGLPAEVKDREGRRQLSRTNS